MRKNKKISTKNLYIRRIVRYKSFDYTMDTLEELNTPLYTIDRADGYIDVKDIFNETYYTIEQSGYNCRMVAVLEQPIITNDCKIRCKDAEEILEKYKEKVKTKN